VQSDITGANISSASQEISCILWDPEVHCCVHDRWPVFFCYEPDGSTTHRSFVQWRTLVLLSTHRQVFPNGHFISVFHQTLCL